MAVDAETYGAICDVIERNFQNYGPRSDDDPFFHTSNEARFAASQILDILGLHTDGVAP